MTIKELEQNYKQKQLIWKTHIRLKSSKWSRFWAWVWYLIAFPFVWLFYNIRDWRTFVIFILVVLVVGVEVWLPLLLGIIFNNAWLLGLAAACETFWLAPFTPFLPLCIFLTIVIKELFNKIKMKKEKK